MRNDRSFGAVRPDRPRRRASWYHRRCRMGRCTHRFGPARSALVASNKPDSITIDAHKWFATTMGCGMFMTPHAPVLSSVFHVSTTFMPSNHCQSRSVCHDGAMVETLLGLRLFLSLAAAGWDGYGQHVERSVELMACSGDELAAKGWTHRAITRRLRCCASNRLPAWARLEARLDRVHRVRPRMDCGGLSLRTATSFGLCLTHGEASAQDILELVNALSARDESSLVGFSRAVRSQPAHATTPNSMGASGHRSQTVSATQSWKSRSLPTNDSPWTKFNKCPEGGQCDHNDEQVSAWKCGYRKSSQYVKRKKMLGLVPL